MAGPVAGKLSKLFVGTATPDTEVKGRVDWNFNLDKTEIDGSHMDVENGWSLFLQGRKSATITGTVRYIEEDPGQVLLVANAFDDDAVLKTKFSFTTAGDEYTCDAFVTNINPSPPDEDVTNMSFTMRVTGAVA